MTAGSSISPRALVVRAGTPTQGRKLLGKSETRLGLHRWERILFPLSVYLLSRLVDGLFLAVGASRQVGLTEATTAYRAQFPVPASPSYWQVLANWDGQWYKSIALNGYPTELPLMDGRVAQNAWAFYPGFPTLVRGVMEITPLGFEAAAGLLSTLCGALSVVLLYIMLRRTADTFVARATVICLCAFVAAPVFQVAYTESLALLLILACLEALRRGHLGHVLGIALALSLTRPVAPALGAVLATHALIRLAGRRQDPKARIACVRRLMTAALVVAMAAIWPAVASLVTGEPRAYLLTMAAWPAYEGAPPIGAWFIIIAEEFGLGMLALLLLIVVGYIALVARPGTQTWGLELRLWAAIYPIYLLLATSPGPSILRYVILAAVPFWPLPDAPDSVASEAQRRVRAGALALLVALGLCAQYIWAIEVFTISVDPGSQPFP